MLYEDVDFIERVREKLNMTWEITPSEKSKISNLIRDGQAWLENRTTNGVVDWENRFNQTMLIDWIRYDYNQAVEYFENNFHSELIVFIIRNDKQYELEKELGESNG